MTQIDQLLAKALSTTSEEEAIACLRMARKKGSTYTTTSKSKTAPNTSSYGGYSAKEWRDAAAQLRQEYDRVVTSYIKLRETYNTVITEKNKVVIALEDQKRVTKVVVVIYSVCLLSVVAAGYML